MRGGTTDEYDLSLKTGHAVLQALPEDKYHVRDIFIDRSGEWHVRGIPTEPVRALQQTDVVINALHGGIGEDGTVGRILEQVGVPYTGTRADTVTRLRSRFVVNELLHEAGFKTPRAVLFAVSNDMSESERAQYVFDHFGPPYIVKPPYARAGVGVRYVPTIVELAAAVTDLLDEYESALVEEFLSGDEVCTSVVEDFREQPLYVFPLTHIDVPEGHVHATFDHHRDGLITHRSPSTFSHEEKKTMERIAREVHDLLGLDHFSRISFLHTRGEPHVIEVDPYPTLYEGAALPTMLSAVGSSVQEFLEHAIHLARR